jgi:anti-anti-sigma factor
MDTGCFTVRIHPPEGGTVRVAVAGEADLASSDELFSALVDAVSLGGVRRVEVDLSRVRLLDAAAVGVLLAARNRAHETHVALRITGAYGLALEVLEVSGVLGVLGGKPEDGTDRHGSR